MIKAALSPMTLSVGVVTDVVITLCNTGTGPCTNVIFQVRLPHEVVLKRGRESVAIPQLSPGQRHELAINLLPRRVGQWTITVPNFSFADPSGRSCRVRDHSWTIEVLPKQPCATSQKDSRLEEPQPAEQHNKKVFISYRRCESAFPANWLYDRLRLHPGIGMLFLDVKSVMLGEDFMKRLDVELATCTSLLAVIGPQWLAIAERRLISADDDLASHEITVALERNIPIIPVLVDGARMPTYRELPEGLRALAHRQAISIEPSRFGADVSEIVFALRQAQA